ncbi:MAG TPA: hypothetical protein VFT36_00430 [Methylomirabilota bacterium]|nr:hypothetical protein [Methylomirabilota bacterium]
MKARFKVQSPALGPIFDGQREATVEVDRERDLFIVRPHRRSQTYALPLWKVAEMVIWRCVKEERT